MEPAGYSQSNFVIQTQANQYSGSVGALVPEPNTERWYKTQFGCIRTDPTLIARLHSFPDAMIPRGLPLDPGPPSKVCSDATCAPATASAAGCTVYRTAWPARVVDPTNMIDVEMNHPQFAFRAGGPGTPYQIDVESQLRRLDQPLGNCQAIIPEDAPLYVNTVAPPAVSGVAYGVQNASNPVAAIVTKVGAEECRIQADTVASAMSGRRFNNPTRQDTMRFDRPFAPPGIGTGEPRPRPVAGQAFYA